MLKRDLTLVQVMVQLADIYSRLRHFFFEADMTMKYSNIEQLFMYGSSCS